jgi:nitrogenase molybdenum-iron protein NifN
MGLDDCDDFTQALAEISGKPVPEKIERHRAQLQDAMVDCHFMIGFARIALAADPDLLGMQVRFLTGMGAEIVSAVSPHKHDSLASLPIPKVIIGDLEDMEKEARAADAQLVIANSHAVETATDLACRCCAPASRSTTTWAVMPAPGWATAARGRPCSISPT